MRTRKHLTNKHRSKISEKDTAKAFQGKIQPASGALPSCLLKGDVVTEKFLIDDKVTGAESYSVTLKFWRKLTNEAANLGKSPMIRLSFTGGGNLYVIDEVSLFRLLKQQQPAERSSSKPFPLRKRATHRQA